MKTTADGKTWSELQEVVALDSPTQRPGMPCVTKIKDGKYRSHRRHRASRRRTGCSQGTPSSCVPFRRWRPLPRPNEKMKSVEAYYESAYGTVTAKSYFEEERWNYEITVPANASATVKLPVSTSEGVTLNGKNATSLSEADGVRSVIVRDGYAVFELVAGTYSFSMNSAVLYRT